MGIEVDGLDDLISRLNSMQNSRDAVVDEALENAAEILKTEIESSVALSNISHKHIREDIVISRINGEGTQKHLFVGPGGHTSWRAKFLEFGTKKMSAKPFMQPSLERQKRNMFERIAAVIRGRLGIGG